MKGILDGMKGLLFEDDPKAKANAKPAPATAAPATAPTAPYMASAVAASLLTAVAETADADTLALFENAVLVPTVDGHPSQFMKFLQMWNALKQPADASVVVMALNVSDPSITIIGVTNDYQAHLKLLENVAAQAEGELQQAGSVETGALDEATNALRALNDSAQAEIERHQRETAERNAQIADLTSRKATSQNATAQAQQRAVVAQNAIRGKLVAMQSILKV